MTPQWCFWIDRGGTFTDIVARRPDGTLIARKLLSEIGKHGDPAVRAIRELLDLEATESIPTRTIDSLRLGTTVATNALLERSGEPTALVITRGFGDALRIGYQSRPRLFDRHIVLPEPLYETVFEIDERMGAHGDVVRPLDEAQAGDALERAREAGMRSVAIVLLHGYRYPEHERALARLAREVGFEHVSTSHDVAPLMKLVSRGDTTVVDATLTPLLRRYVNRLTESLGHHPRVFFMQSNGGLVRSDAFRGKDSLLSGPVGGVVAAASVAPRPGFENIIAFDMGGTSTDVSHFAGELERASETHVAGFRIRSPMLRIHTVAAGGGSILKFDGTRYRVGPESAGADPGPACYGRGGPLTVTDCNVMLGKLRAEFFPRVLGPGADEPLDSDVVTAKFEALAAEIAERTGDVRTPAEVAEGFLRIAVQNMANAIKEVSIRRGHDVTTHGLVAFGGAGGQHACLVADVLGMPRILIHPLAGVLSAYGMGRADVRAIRQRAIEDPLTVPLVPDLGRTLASLAGEARDAVREQDPTAERVEVRERVHLRYAGTATPLEVRFADEAEMHAEFEAAHRRVFGFAVPGREIVVESVEAEAIGVSDAPAWQTARDMSDETPMPVDTVPIRTGGATHDAPIYERSALRVDDRIEGPAIVVEPHATTVVEPGWAADVADDLSLVLQRTVPLPRLQNVATRSDPVMLEVFNNLFMSVATQMGAVLEKTAFSVNIRERLDFSCAIFDVDGRLVANAPHMPVHLGSMGESVRMVLRDRGSTMRAGDVYALNAPYRGGTHLPDITVVRPLFGSGGELVFWVAARGHHADVGGSTPGSMPPDSQTIDEEGVLIEDFLLVRDDRFREAELRRLLAAGEWPARNPDQNVADLRAQVAACETGEVELRRLVDQFGVEVVHAYMGYVQENGADQVRRVIDRLRDGHFRYGMDGGGAVEVRVSVNHTDRRARIDFTGSSEQLSTNFNAPPAVTRAAVLYVFRTLIDDDIPLNEGCLDPLEIVIPEGSLLNPRYPAAVVAGNVETSQCVVDALFGALGELAAAQGTMNNFTFGDERAQYYETVCGGSGAGPDHDGTDAVHTHMTNSLLTDPEVLEWRFPARVEDFRVRRDSGGAGRRRGGDGTVRRIRFLEPMTAAIVSGRREVPPFGLAGGEPGAPGRNTLERDGRRIELSATDRVEVERGDVISIETPGGGGFGPRHRPGGPAGGGPVR